MEQAAAAERHMWQDTWYQPGKDAKLTCTACGEEGYPQSSWFPVCLLPYILENAGK